MLLSNKATRVTLVPFVHSAGQSFVKIMTRIIREVRADDADSPCGAKNHIYQDKQALMKMKTFHPSVSEDGTNDRIFCSSVTRDLGLTLFTVNLLSVKGDCRFVTQSDTSYIYG
jgi:hypothetical protein